MSTEQEIGRALIAECARRLFDEGQPRLEACLALLDDTEIWARPSDRAASVGNLVLHLCGNVKQWIGTGLGGRPDTRLRSGEFAETGPIARAQLLSQLAQVMAEAREVLAELDPTTLGAPRSVQVFTESGVSILVHVVEHFSYHVGQVTWFVKVYAGKNVDYYGGQNLEVGAGHAATEAVTE